MSSKITEPQLAEYFRLNSERQDLQRRADAIDRQLQPTKDAIKSMLEESGKTSLKRGQFTAQLVDGRALVNWKDEFVRAADADTAAQIQAAAPKSKYLQVTKTE